MNDPSVVFHIDCTLKVAMVTENDRQNRLKSKKISFSAEIWRLNRQVNIEHFFLFQGRPKTLPDAHSSLFEYS